jgi:hypothetical protein
MAHHLAMRPPTMLAAALGAHETDPAADLEREPARFPDPPLPMRFPVGSLPAIAA